MSRGLAAPGFACGGSLDDDYKTRVRLKESGPCWHGLVKSDCSSQEPIPYFMNHKKKTAPGSKHKVLSKKGKSWLFWFGQYP